MHAQLLPFDLAPGRPTELERLVTDQLLPALRRAPGFAGSLNLVDREAGSLLLIVLWESAEAARRLDDRDRGDVATAFARIAALSAGELRPASLWEIGARV